MTQLLQPLTIDLCNLVEQTTTSRLESLNDLRYEIVFAAADEDENDDESE